MKELLELSRSSRPRTGPSPHFAGPAAPRREGPVRPPKNKHMRGPQMHSSQPPDRHEGQDGARDMASNKGPCLKHLKTSRIKRCQQGESFSWHPGAILAAFSHSGLCSMEPNRRPSKIQSAERMPSLSITVFKKVKADCKQVTV